MKVGLIGAGNMARALARGWGEPVLCSDSGSGRAQALVAELGGEVLSNVEVAGRAELVVLCHKPYQLQAVAEEIRGHARAVASVLGGVPVDSLQKAYPGIPVFRTIPNIAVEVRRGIVCSAIMPELTPYPELEPQVVALFERLGTVVRLPEPMMGP